MASGDLIYNYSLDSDAYYRVCAHNIDQTVGRFIVTNLVLISAYSLFGVGTPYAYFTEGRLTTLFNFKIPMVVDGSVLAFAINMALQTFAFFIGMPGNIGVEGNITLLMDSITASTAVIQLQSSLFSEALKAKRIAQRQQKKILVKMFTQMHTVNR